MCRIGKFLAIIYYLDENGHAHFESSAINESLLIGLQ